MLSVKKEKNYDNWQLCFINEGQQTGNDVIVICATWYQWQPQFPSSRENANVPYVPDEDHYIWESNRQVVDLDAPFWDDGHPDPPNKVETDTFNSILAI